MHALGRSIQTECQEEVMNKQDIVLSVVMNLGFGPGHLLGCDDLEEKVLMSRWTGKGGGGQARAAPRALWGFPVLSSPNIFRVASLQTLASAP